MRIRAKEVFVDRLMWTEMVKYRLSVTISPPVLKWVDEEVEKKHFADRSHAVEYSLVKIREFIKKGEIKF